MKTLLIARDFPPDIGGVQTVLGALARLRPGTRVIARRTEGHVEFDRDFPAPVERLPRAEIPVPVLSQVARQVWLLAAVWRAWRRERFDLVIAGYLAHAGPVAWLWRRLFGVRYVVMTYGMEIGRARRSPLAWLWRRVLREAAVVATIAEPVADLLRAFEPGANVVKVPLGRPEPVSVNHPAAGAPLPPGGKGVGGEGLTDFPDKRVLLTVARLVPRKGVDTTLRALALLRRRDDLVYVVAGDGPDAGRLRALARDLGVADRVAFTGRVDDARLAALFARCDLFVMPSRAEGDDIEGFGLVFVEAGAHGKPVIGGRSGGVSEAVRDGENGLLVDPTDAADLARAVERVLDDPDLAARLGDEGRRLAEEVFTFDNMVRALNAALDEEARP